MTCAHNLKRVSQQIICTVPCFFFTPLFSKDLVLPFIFSTYGTHCEKPKHNIQPWYVSLERVWHALRACVENSNGTTNPQLDLWADSTHPPTRPSVLLCIGKQAWCMHAETHGRSVHRGHMWFTRFCRSQSGFLVHSQSAVRRTDLLCPQDDNSSLHHLGLVDRCHAFTSGFVLSWGVQLHVLSADLPHACKHCSWKLINPL